ncbi:hypothetical protein [Saccharopolyspora erythraea]|uniref:Nudix hydrolase domain-containing protein n=2 Tax=Saccharopolyspora erythraea TaxID=1836 RepID=A4FDI0_SACEN|nr:hypothetical protein [Saccharopolyspora erythraea]EQD82540.1 hypothetical protein N599_30015 [Saccharopolyspora erythraea D]QRK92424.1 hypothetical protein JQX30_14565 [Saccharopolyspora erythraea]CAM02105.1 hypothetical protein SACE_2826 [Saccharopolyspora erythraea NRRL 2338]
MDAFSLKDVVLLVVGAGMGAFAERVLGRPWDRHVMARMRKLRARRKGRKAMRKLAVSGEFLTLGHARERVFVHQFSPRGFGRDHLDTKLVVAEPLGERIERLPEELRPVAVAELPERIEQQRRRIEDDPSAWNEEKLGVAAVRVSRDPRYDEPQLRIHFHQTDYATFSVLTNAWAQHVRDLDVETLSAGLLREVLPGLSHSFGINATVVTADGRLLLTKRNARISSNRPLTHISVNEGMRADDLTAGRPDPYATLRRGIEEELGIDIPPAAGVFHSLILDANRYQWAFLGHVDLAGTKWDAARVKAARAAGRSIDNWETDAVRDIPFTFDAVVEELADHQGWIAHGWANMLLTALYEFPSKHDRLLDVLSRARP